MVEIDKERPVDEPRAGVKLGEGRFWEVVGVGGCRGEEGGGRPGVDGFSKSVEFLEGDFPSAGEDVRGEFAPVGRVVEVVVGG